MGIDGKYGRVTTERGDIGEDEPVIVFRAQDRVLPSLLVVYRTLCEHRGSPQRHLDLIDGAVAAIEEWQENHRTKVPESAGYEGPSGGIWP